MALWTGGYTFQSCKNRELHVVLEGENNPMGQARVLRRHLGVLDVQGSVCLIKDAGLYPRVR